MIGWRATTTILVVASLSLAVTGASFAGTIDTGATFESGAQLAFDGAGNVVVAANDAATDELVVARFGPDGDIDSSWGDNGVARVLHSSINGSTPDLGYLDIAAAEDGRAWVRTGGIAYGFSSIGAPLWETATARCDVPGLPVISLSPDESILWTGALDDGGCTIGTIGKIDAISGERLAQGHLDPYAFAISAIDAENVWVVDSWRASMAHFGALIGDPSHPWDASHEVVVDATIPYPAQLKWSYLPLASQTTEDGSLFVAGPLRSSDPNPTVATLMRMSVAGMDAGFGSGGSVEVATEMRVVGVALDSTARVFLILSDEATGEVHAFLEDGKPDLSFGTNGVLSVGHKIDEATASNDRLGLAWVNGPSLDVELIDIGPPPPSPTFTDDDDSIFEPDIEWLAASGITRGCNPPVNDRFCPNRTVTRGQMAAFLHRALPDLPEVRSAIDFTDDDASVFEADIEWLYSRGVTQGTSATTFAPDRPVTRGQMAAFLVRALKYSDNGGGDLFIDDNTSQFEGDIDRLGTAGVTRGCNPPTNDLFCPDGFVTRGQMAAFLHRALWD